MEFKVERRKHPNTPHYPSDDLATARHFATKIHTELKDFAKSIILFGSSARRLHEDSAGLPQTHDIDILMLVDDLTIIASPEVIQAYRVIVERTASTVSARLHINTLKLTTFWDYIRMGDPIMINTLRDGIPLYDTGFFEPIQHLLFQGRIRPTKEAMWTYFSRAPASIRNANAHVMQASRDLYWAVMDSAHAALIKAGEAPQTPDHVPAMLDQTFVKLGKLKKAHVETAHFFYVLNKKLEDHHIMHVTGEEYDQYTRRAREFIDAMRTIINEH